MSFLHFPSRDKSLSKTFCTKIWYPPSSIILKMADRCLRPVPPRKPRHPYINKLETIFKNPNSSQLAKSLYLLRYITSKFEVQTRIIFVFFSLFWFSLTFTFLSIVQFCMETLPNIKFYSEQGSHDSYDINQNLGFRSARIMW